MIIAPLLLFLAANAIDLDIVTIPLNNDMKVALVPAGRTELKRLHYLAFPAPGGGR